MILEPKSIENTAKEYMANWNFTTKCGAIYRKWPKDNGYELDEKSAKIRPYGKERSSNEYYTVPERE